MDPEIIRKVEAVLFVSGRYMDAARIAELIEASEKSVKQALGVLRDTYTQNAGALHVAQEQNAWKLHVRDEYLDLVSRVISDTEVSGPVLETLAIIAWRSPVLQAEVVDIRGSNAYEHIKELVERGFVTKEPKGRSFDLRITEKFFDYFDIEGREDIRKVFKDVEEEHRKKEMDMELEQKRLAAAIAKAENGEVAEVDMPEVDTQQKLPQKKMDIDKLDEILEKSAKTREKIGAELSAMRIKNEPESDSAQPSEGSDGETEPADEEEVEVSDEESLSRAKKVREQVEKDADEL